MKISFKKKWSDHICVGLLEYSVSVIYVFFYQYHTLNSFSLIVTFNLIFSLQNLRIACNPYAFKDNYLFYTASCLGRKNDPSHLFIVASFSLHPWQVDGNQRMQNHNEAQDHSRQGCSLRHCSASGQLQNHFCCLLRHEGGKAGGRKASWGKKCLHAGSCTGWCASQVRAIPSLTRNSRIFSKTWQGRLYSTLLKISEKKKVELSL